MSDLAPTNADYRGMHGDIVALLEAARRTAARSVNALMTASYWEIGRRIVEFEQGGEDRAAYGHALLAKLSADLTRQFGRGFGVDNLELMRLFYLTYPPDTISESQVRKFDTAQLTQVFPLSWTHYIHLMRRTRSTEEREFYEAEALRGGWSVRQLDRQIGSQFYTRALLSKNKHAMLEKGGHAQPADHVTPEEAIKDPCYWNFSTSRTSTLNLSWKTHSFIA